MKSSTSPELVVVCIVRAKISLNQRVPEFFINGCVRRKLSGNSNILYCWSYELQLTCITKMHLFVFFFQSKTVKIAKKGQFQTFFYVAVYIMILSIFVFFSCKLILCSLKVTSIELLRTYNITPESHIKVFRVREMITNYQQLKKPLTV